MEDHNVYQSPTTNVVPGAETLHPAERQSGVTERMVAALRRTRPWVLFLAVLGFITSGFMVLLGMAMTLMSSFMGGMQDELGFPPIILGLVYLFVAAIYFFPCLLLQRYASAIRELVSGGGVVALEDALERQQSFWRLLGILALVTIVLYLLVILGFIVFGVIAAASG